MGNLLHKGWRPNCPNSNHDNVDVGALIKVELYNTLSKPGKKI